MRIIDEIGRNYPGLDLESIRILLTVYEHPGFCVREVAEILGLDHKNVQLKIALMAAGRKNRKSRRMQLITSDYKVSDKRKRDLMVTEAGRELAAQFAGLGK